MNNLLHISGNRYSGIKKTDHSYRIWRELANGVDNYYLLARSTTNKFSIVEDGNITLILIPKVVNTSKVFVLTSLVAFYYVYKYKITRILVQDALAGGLTAVLVSKVFKIPVMVEIHGDVYFDYFKEDSFKKTLLSKFSKLVFRNASKVRSLSSVMTTLLGSSLHLNNIVLIPNRVDCKLFAPPKVDYSLNKPITITSVGRFVAQKGFEVAIEAMKVLGCSYDIKLILIGGGPLKSNYLNMINNNDNVSLIDWIDQSELTKLLKSSDIYIQPSIPFLGEAMPRTILEAMAMGLPIVSTRVCAVPGILNESNSVLIDSGSVQTLVLTIEQLIKNQNLRQKIGQNAFHHASSEYNWDKMFNLYRMEINQMVYK